MNILSLVLISLSFISISSSLHAADSELRTPNSELRTFLLGLPSPLPVPETNPLAPEKIELGRRLFFDRRLSPNDTMSCAMCHIPTQGFTVNEARLAVGMIG